VPNGGDMLISFKKTGDGVLPIMGSIIYLVFVFILLCTTANAVSNTVYYDIVLKNHSSQVDTIYEGEPYEMRTYIENIDLLRGLYLAFTFNTTIEYDGVEWYWLPQSGGYGASSCVTVVPGCRMSNGNGGVIWDEAWVIYEVDMDEFTPDSIYMNGLSGDSSNYMSFGDLEHMFSIHFKAKADQYGGGYIDFDSASIPAMGCIMFSNSMAMPIYPEVIPGIGRCLPVQDRGYLCGDVNDDGVVNVFDITYLISYLYMSGPPPVHANSGDVNHDGATNIFDVSYLQSYLYMDGPAPYCY
jgi:hypothetical protein